MVAGVAKGVVEEKLSEENQVGEKGLAVFIKLITGDERERMNKRKVMFGRGRRMKGDEGGKWVIISVFFAFW